MSALPTLDQLAALRALAALGRQSSDADVQSVAAALDKWLTDQEAGTLDDALNLAPAPGRRRVQTIAAIAQRDQLLRDAASTFFPGQSTAEQARRLATALARYRRGADWSRDRAAGDVTYRDTLRGYCWAALRIRDHDLSERQIRRVLSWP